MAKGRKTGGRKKGTKNKKPARTARREAEASGILPLDYMLGVMRDKDAALERRDDMAKASAPYLHAKLTKNEHFGKDGGPIETKDMTALELGRRIAFSLQLAAPKE